MDSWQMEQTDGQCTTPVATDYCAALTSQQILVSFHLFLMNIAQQIVETKLDTQTIFDGYPGLALNTKLYTNFIFPRILVPCAHSCKRKQRSLDASIMLAVKPLQKFAWCLSVNALPITQIAFAMLLHNLVGFA